MDSRPSAWRFVGLRDGMMRMDAQGSRSERAQQGADDDGSGSPPRKWRIVPRVEGAEAMGCPPLVARVGERGLAAGPTAAGFRLCGAPQSRFGNGASHGAGAGP